MLLTFSKDMFVDAIKTGRKIHTIRPDKPKRWRPDMKIHFWRGNPRNVKSNPYSFGEDICKRVDELLIKRIEKSEKYPDQVSVLINSTWLNFRQIRELAKNDGLTIEQFRMWFVPPGNEIFRGRIIHWTNHIYDIYN